MSRGRFRSPFRSRGLAALGVVVATCVLWGLAPAAPAQRDEVDLGTIEKQAYKRITLKMLEPEFETAEPQVRRSANEGRETLARDLIYSGLFYVMDQWASPYLPRGVTRAWNVTDENPERRPHEIHSIWRSEDGQLVIEMRLVDVLGTQIAGKRYKVEPGGERSAMHHFADEVVKRLTGVEGTAQTKIAFARVRGERSEIYTVDYDGFGERQVTDRNVLSLSPVWGKGRKWIAFTSYLEGRPYLYRIDQGSSRMRVVSDRPGLNTAPEWSEEKKRYAVTLSHEGNAEVYTIDESGRRLKRLTHHPAIDTSPSWSPRGDQIAFTSDRSGVPQIYVMDSDGGNVRRLTYHNRYSDSPAWSPDGRWIAYVARWEGNIELRLMKPDGTDQRVVVSRGLNDGPSWAKDSRHSAFSSMRYGVRAFYVVDVYKRLERRLTSGSQDAITPAWSRD
ncbi:MAG: hypothetical protein ACE5G2_02430 [Candidatus Krumholzibacteriia bacterium]